MFAALALAPLLIAPVAGRAPLTAPTPPTADDARAARFADPAAAAADAADRGAPLVIVLTATDWCGPCADLDDAVFDRGPFARAAAEFAVLHVDTADEGDDPAVRARYEALAARYRTRSVPTVIVADPAGRPLGVTGNTADDRLSPGRYRAHLRALAARRPARDAAFTRAETLDGPAKAAALHAGLAAVWVEEDGDRGETLLAEYAPEIAALLAADPADETGFAGLWRGRLRTGSAAERTAELRRRLRAANDAGGVDAALAVRDELVAGGLTPAERSAVADAVTVLLSWADRPADAAALTAKRLRGLDSAFAPPTDLERWHLRERLAFYTSRTGDIAEGDRLFGELVGELLDAGDRDLAYRFARVWQQQMLSAGRFDEALAALDADPLRSPPASADPGDRAFLRSLVHRRAGRPAAAAAALAEMIPQLPEGWNRLGWRAEAAGLLLDAGDRAAAAAALAAAAEPRPAGDAEAAALFDRFAAELAAVRRRLHGPLTAPKPPPAGPDA